jgi:dihydrofolate reductase
VIIIAAMGKNRVIGSGAGMPWDVPEEFRQFLNLVDGHPVIMGRRSWEIFGPQLSGVHPIVVSRRIAAMKGAIVRPSVQAAVAEARRWGGKFFSAGGAQIYAQTIPLAEAMYLSTIKGEFSGDTYFPAFDESEWKVTRHEDHPAFEFRVYERS